MLGHKPMPPVAKTFLVIGALACLLAVVLGAFGAHALRARLAPDLLAVYYTGVQYHFWHALGLLAIALALAHFPAAEGLKWAGWLMLAGILIFSGSLYLLAATGQRWFGAITPIGGTAFIAAWATFAYAILRTA
jgi:uncharacterized membrane protein YgdD (TMEM256/DUF423 family)